jgi:hypothetical protein
MSMRIVVRPQSRNRSLSIVYVAGDVKISTNANSPVITELEKATALMNHPEFAPRRRRGHLFDGKDPADNNTLLDISLLRDEKHLVAGAWWARQSPAVSHPLR